MKRHKPPTLVSMWMLDVFCCALGCVTLLWLLKTREAGFALDETANVRSELTNTRLELGDSISNRLQLDAMLEEAAANIARINEERDRTATQLALVEKDRDDKARQLARTREELDKTGKRLALIEKEADATAKNLAVTEKKLDETQKAMTVLQTKATASEDELAKKKTDLAALGKQMDATKKDADDLMRLLREKQTARDEEAKKNAELAAKVDKLNKEKSDGDKLGADLVKAIEKLKKLEKELGDSNASIVDLQGTKAKLADKINRLEIETQNRFAGIALTGKRVVFLVDISGSMEMTDEKTVEPTKWPTVRDTLIKVMRSLPDLEKFQVILFSNRVQYLLPESKDWITYEKEKTLQRIEKAMSQTKPVGDTNMYQAFEEVFKYRSKGMDTVYLFSDGLPNSGPGLTEQQLKANLSETDRQSLLARFIRNRLNGEWNRALPNQPKVRINSIGFFFESPDVGAFLWALSRENDGSFVGMSKP